MTVQYSTALKNRLLGGGSGDDDLKSIFAEGFIVVYAGAMPDVDSVSVGTVLCVLSAAGATPAAGTGLNLGTAASGSIPKDSDVWQGEVDNPGDAETPTYARWVQNASATSIANVETEAAVIGTTALRMQLKIGSVPASDVDFVITDFPADGEDFIINAASLYY
jgi:hypothetical protein